MYFAHAGHTHTETASPLLIIFAVAGVAAVLAGVVIYQLVSRRRRAETIEADDSE
jgi:hypothetical protein